MNEVVFTSSCAPLSGEHIARFEAQQKIKLPPKYRAFLLRVNGGHPHKPMGAGCYVQNVFAITDADTQLSLARDMAGMKSDLPKGLIPIIFANGGDRVCLSL